MHAMLTGEKFRKAKARVEKANKLQIKMITLYF